MKSVEVLGRPAVERAVTSAERLLRGSANRLVVLTYHRVSDVVDDGRHTGLISATPAEFADHARILENRFNVVSLDRVIAAARRESELPRRSLLITFDDAVDDFERHALPVLRKHQLPAVLFVPTAFVGRQDLSFWWDALHAAVTKTRAKEAIDTPLGRLPLDTAQARRSAFTGLRAYCKEMAGVDASALADRLCEELDVPPPSASVMSWEALSNIHAEGLVSVCPHTRTHPHLDHLEPAEIFSEIAGSYDDLRRELGTVQPALAYPAGRVNDQVARIAADAGMNLGFTTRTAVASMRAVDPLQVPRINVGRRAGLTLARIRALPAIGGLVPNR